MNRQETIDLICEVFEELAPSQQAPPALTETTPLLGSTLDSVGVVSLIVELEQQITDRSGLSVTIADDRAMSQQRSPFRTIGTLADYIQELISEQLAKA